MARLNPNDYINKTFGRLTGLEFVGTKDYDKFMKWKCECGNIVELPITRVKNGYVQSCGCLAKEIAAKRLKKNNEYDLSGEYGIGCTSSGYEFYFDLEDYDKIKEFCWHRHRDGYLRTRVDVYPNGKNHYELMHRWILDIKDTDVEIDHINGNVYDNRKFNLRVVEGSKNAKNLKLYINNKSGHKGVSFSKRENRWKAYIQNDNQKIHLGTFSVYEDAVKARELAEVKYFGDYSRKSEDLMNGTGCWN